MPTINVSLTVAAPAHRCFDLARSIEFHLKSTPGSGEVVVGGRRSGHMELHDTVTWRARHLGFNQNLTSQITAYERPRYFQDCQVRGAFRMFRHDHLFDAIPDSPGLTRVTDVFTFESPLGLLGRLANTLFLTAYMTDFLTTRLEILKRAAESEEWRKYCEAPTP
jgi:ligand-binding SRPBCC domain-containing protein